MTVYMRVSRDKYELPDAVSESIVELANLCGVPKDGPSMWPYR